MKQAGIGRRMGVWLALAALALLLSACAEMPELRIAQPIGTGSATSDTTAASTVASVTRSTTRGTTRPTTIHDAFPDPDPQLTLEEYLSKWRMPYEEHETGWIPPKYDCFLWYFSDYSEYPDNAALPENLRPQTLYWRRMDGNCEVVSAVCSGVTAAFDLENKMYAALGNQIVRFPSISNEDELEVSAEPVYTADFQIDQIVGDRYALILASGSRVYRLFRKTKQLDFLFTADRPIYRLASPILSNDMFMYTTDDRNLMQVPGFNSQRDAEEYYAEHGIVPRQWHYYVISRDRHIVDVNAFMDGFYAKGYGNVEMAPAVFQEYLYNWLDTHPE